MQMGFLLLVLLVQTKRLSLAVVLVGELNILNCKKLAIKWMGNDQPSEIVMRVCGVLAERLLQIHC